MEEGDWVNGFNPHAREGRDWPYVPVLPSRFVSIHTPVRGVTASLTVMNTVMVVSIHTPVRGVTYLS